MLFLYCPVFVPQVITLTAFELDRVLLTIVIKPFSPFYTFFTSILVTLLIYSSFHNYK